MASQNLLPLRAGPVRLWFDPGNAGLRHLRVGSSEACRGIYAAVRDHNWGTVLPDLQDLRVEPEADRFTITFQAVCRRGAIDFRWQGRIHGDPDGRIVYHFEGQALTTFRRARIGFCILHDPGCAGLPCTVETVDGQRRPGAFPAAISPHQPFTELRAIAHHLAGGAEVEVRMEGDTFEMEDQRNWTDASFKTYCTPLSRPFPVEVAAGTRVEQTITFTVTGAAVPPPEEVEGPLVVALRRGNHPLPQLGLQATRPDQPTLGAAQLGFLRSLRLSFWRIEVQPGAPGWEERVAAGLREARQLDLPVELAWHLGPPPQEALAALRRIWATAPAAPRVARWLALARRRWAEHAADLAELRRLVAEGPWKAPVLAGTNANFTELNRHRPDPAAADGVVYAINPQVHAFDDLSLVETLAMHAETVRNASTLAAGRPVAVSPITLRPRFNPVATGPADSAEAAALPPDVDPRQREPFAALWTLGSVRALAEAGAASACYYEPVGWKGLLADASGSPLPALFPARPNEVFPVGKLWQALAPVREGRVWLADCADPLRLDGLGLEEDHRLRLFLAHHAGETAEIRLSWPEGARFRGGEVLATEHPAEAWAVEEETGALRVRLPGRTLWLGEIQLPS